MFTILTKPVLSNVHNTSFSFWIKKYIFFKKGRMENPVLKGNYIIFEIIEKNGNKMGKMGIYMCIPLI